VTIANVDQEVARDLVPGREDHRGDLMMCARHRPSKLRLRRGIVHFGVGAWTGKHDSRLRHDAVAQPGQVTSRATRMAFDADHETVLAVKARRDRLDAAITAMAADSELTAYRGRTGHRPCSRRNTSRILLRRPPAGGSTWSDPRHNAESSVLR
jgi:transposase